MIRNGFIRPTPSTARSAPPSDPKYSSASEHRGSRFPSGRPLPARASAPQQSCQGRRIVGVVHQQVGQRGRIAFGHAGGAGDHGGQAAADRLVNTQAICLVARRRHQHIAGRQQPGHVPAKSEEAHAVFELRFTSAPLPEGQLGSRANDDQVGIPVAGPAQMLPGPEQRVEALAAVAEGAMNTARALGRPAHLPPRRRPLLRRNGPNCSGSMP